MGFLRRRLTAEWPIPNRRRHETASAEEDGRFEREGKWAVRNGIQRWSEDIEDDHEFETQEAMARVLGSRY